MSDASLLPSSGLATFNSGLLSGFITPPGNVPIPMPPGMMARLQVRAWDNRRGTVRSWEQAVADPTVARGASASIIVGLGGQQIPPLPPTLLTGLESFNLHLPLRLATEQKGETLVLSWPEGFGIRLQKTTDLSNPDWQDIPGTDAMSQISIMMEEQHAFIRAVMDNLRASPASAIPLEVRITTPEQP